MATKVLLEATTMRQQRGEATSLDVLQQRQQLASIETQVPRSVFGLKVAHQRLSLLIGENPSSAQEVASDFSMPQVISNLSREELLRLRPDVEAAQHRVNAAKKRRYSAMSSMFPSLSIGGQLSRQLNYSTKDEEWNSIDTYAFSTGVSITLFQGGARWANFQSAHAAERIAEENLRQTNLLAQQELLQTVENEESNKAILLAASNNLEASKLAFQEARNRYAEGLTPLLSLLTTQQSYLQAQLTYIQSQRDVLAGRLQTYRVLGGARLEKVQ